MTAFHTGLGWAILGLALALPGYAVIWLVLSLLRTKLPLRRLSWPQSLVVTAVSGVAAFLILPLLVHALLGRPDY